ncbi:RNA polymerase sigma factor [Actinomadura geliboluensis]|uniref:Sigma-70 family RNA polymerase sigma factor n=1 Tax=Actinomadura geliboluensis TaxID=882440 RepID=A0A5S4H5L8_9ACTN|nr:sigma-70 family RNA polymerase sigma factor [Actinomadura geliboluensis]TMR40242.1 sigma-70 family RNA polymerase sigma factor [Actinomadura geliboluensis]
MTSRSDDTPSRRALALADLAPQPCPAPAAALNDAELFETWGKSDVPSAHLGVLLDDFRQFFIEVYPRLVAVLTVRTRDRYLAEDIAQETMVLVIRNWQRVCQADQPVAYAMKIAMRLMGRLVLPVFEGVQDVVPPRRDPEGRPVDEKVITRMMVQRAVMALPPRQAEIVIRAYLLEQDTKTIAKDMGIATSTVRVQLLNGRRALRASLSPLRSDGERKNR